MNKITVKNDSEINKYLDDVKKEVDKEYDRLFQKLGIKPELGNSVRAGIEKAYLNVLLTGGIGFDLNKISKEK
jgi:hypothetical protein